MKNIRQDFEDSLRPEYRRSDFGEMTQGKHATTRVEFAKLVNLLLACIGEDEGLKIIDHSQRNPLADRKQGDWTYEIDNANQITLRYWVNEHRSVDEPCVNIPNDRSDLQALLIRHVQILKNRVVAMDQD